jgi:phosphatidylserine/phosphatidylglycerophosphate/cardiolipin synthase-like enzyme
VGIARVRGVDRRNAELFARAFATIGHAVAPSAVALALRTGRGVTVREAAQRPQVEVVWTGPEAGGPLVRPTTAVIREMLRDTRAGGEILLVGYSLTADDGSPSADIIGLLVEASKEQAQVRVVLHKDEEAKNRKNLLAAWSAFAVKPTIYTWEPPTGGPYRKMHAKTLVVDRVEVLVTSANLTFHGLSENIELGLRVRGPQAAAIAQRFDHLIGEHVLRVWS